MTIPSFKILKKNAAERVAAAENSRKIVLIYAGIVTLLAALVTVADYVLELQIAKTGGLSNMGLRSILSTFQSVLPLVQTLVVLCLETGYIAAMVRIARQQYASEHTLKLGFDRFWVLLRWTVIQSCIYMLAAMAAAWLAVQIFMILPLSDPCWDLLEPYLSDPNALMALTQDAAFADQLMQTLWPAFLMFGVLYLAFFLPISYSLRMAKYVIIDKPGQGAMYALKESKKMMKGSCVRLFKLDVSLWWWYALTLASSALTYGGVFLSNLGVTLPWSDTVTAFLFYGLYLTAHFITCVLLQNRVEVVYAQAYNALKPREKDTGVVLGNIFQM